MDGGKEGGVVAWLIDVTAASLLGAAFAFAGTMLADPGIGMAVGTAAILLALAVLRMIRPEPRTYSLPSFVIDDPDLVDLEVLELTEREPLELDDVLAAVTPDARVVALFPASPLPTAGELIRRIETHLAGPAHLAPPESPPEPGAKVVHLGADASAALREALADLRRSLG